MNDVNVACRRVHHSRVHLQSGAVNVQRVQRNEARERREGTQSVLPEVQVADRCGRASRWQAHPGRGEAVGAQRDMGETWHVPELGRQPLQAIAVELEFTERRQFTEGRRQLDQCVAVREQPAKRLRYL